MTQLAAFVDSTLLPQEISAAEPEYPVKSEAQNGDPCVHVAGAACLLPGCSNSPVRFWSLLSKAQDPICSVPNGRWNESDWARTDTDGASTKCYVQCGGFLEGLELFDSTFFSISSAEARQMDPQQCSVLEVCNGAS